MQGSWANGSTMVNGTNYPTDLIITNCYNTTPNEYTATNTITFVGEYVDNGNDDYVVYIVDGSTTTSSNGGSVSSLDGYRYGFNGKENDKDISEGGQDYGMRIYDSRLGKFLSVDPITKSYVNPIPVCFKYTNTSNRFRWQRGVLYSRDGIKSTILECTANQFYYKKLN
jgi:RHS repeat-associated protein